MPDVWPPRAADGVHAVRVVKVNFSPVLFDPDGVCARVHSHSHATSTRQQSLLWNSQTSGLWRTFSGSSTQPRCPQFFQFFQFSQTEHWLHYDARRRRLTLHGMHSLATYAKDALWAM